MDNDQPADFGYWSWLTSQAVAKQSCLRSSRTCLSLAQLLPRLGLFLLVGWSGFCAEYSWAQIVVGDRDDEVDKEIERSLRDTLAQKEQSVFIPPPREIIRPLLRADRAIRENDITRAVTLIGEVLSDSTSEDYLVPVASSVEGVSTSLRLRAQAILGSLSEKDRKLYRLRYGIQARKILEKALQSDDFTGVSQVMQRFFFTDAGFDAAMLLGHYHLDEGRPIAAANCFSRVTRSAEARAIHDPEASVLLATCWMLADLPKRSVAALTELKKNNNRDSIMFMGQPVQLFDEGDEALDWLQNLIGDSPLQEIATVNQWVMSGGNPQRNARSGTGFPLISPRWSTVTLNNPGVEELAVRLQDDLIQSKSAPIPAVRPLALGDTIVMRSFDQMIGVDFKTGKRVWVFPPTDFSASVLTDKFNEKSRKVPETPMMERLWQDSIYGQASSDGQRIFVVPKPGFSTEAAKAGSKAAEPFVNRTYNELKAVDVQRQGAFVWEVGGETGLDEPKLAKTLFLGAPLPLRGELFAVCYQESEVLLVVLDARSGKLNWQQRLGTTDTSIKIGSDRYRRLSGATPSFADGIIVCSTGTGALVGVDLSTRSLIWGYQYISPGKKKVQPISPDKLSGADPLSGLWRDSAITIAEGKVLFTPVDSQDLICVDLQSGFPGYDRSTGKASKSPRIDSLLVACVENGLTVLLGESNVRAISLATGNPIWKLELGEYGKPSGRGYANRGSYYFPTTSKHVLQVDLKTGKLVKAVGTERVLGNLICHKGDVLSHSVDRLSSYLQDEPMRELVERAQREGEMTHQQLAIKSQLQLQDGDLPGAIESIELAFEQSGNSAYQSMLLDLILQTMRTDFDNSVALADKHIAALMSQRKLEYLTSKIHGQIRDGKYKASIDDLFDLLQPIEEVKNFSREFVEVSTRIHDAEFVGENLDSAVSGIRKAESVDFNISIRLDRWVARKFGVVWEKSSQEQRADFGNRINEVASELRAASPPVGDVGSALELCELLEVFPLELIDPEIRFELFEQLVVGGEYLQANRLQASFESGVGVADKKFAAQASAILAELWIESGSPDKAVAMANHIVSSYPEVVVSGEQRGAEFAEAILERAGNEVAQAVGDEFDFNQVDISLTTTDSNKLAPCRVVLTDCDNAKYKAYQFRFQGQTGEFFINDSNGNEIHRFYARKDVGPKVAQFNEFTEGRISIKNELALVDIAQEMFVFDCVKLQKKLQPVLWYNSISSGRRETVSDAIPDSWGEIEIKTASRGYESRVFVSPLRSDVVCYFDAPHLVAVDTRTGKKIWHRTCLHHGTVLLGNEEHVVAWNSIRRELDFYSPADGRRIATRKLPAEVGSVWQAYGARFLVSSVRSRSSGDGEAKGKSNNRGGGRRQRVAQVKTLGLYDPLSQKYVWEREFPLSSSTHRLTLACRVGHDRIAVLPPGDELEFIDVNHGELLFKTPIKLRRADRQAVDGIGVVIKRGKYLIHLKRGYCPTSTTINELNVGFHYLNYYDKSWLGNLVCVDSQTGQDLWRDHVRFDYFQIGQRTPFDSPMYFFVRRFVRNVSANSDMKSQVVGINLATGEPVFNSLLPSMANYGANYWFNYDPSRQEMTLDYEGHRNVFKLGYADDLPPVPVTHLLKFNAIPPSVDTNESHLLDTDLIKAEQEKVLQKAVEAQELLAEKRAREKRLLEAERENR